MLQDRYTFQNTRDQRLYAFYNICKWKLKNIDWSSMLVADVAYYGHIRTLKMLRSHNIDRHNGELLRNACAEGHIRIVKYVHNDNISFGDGLYVLACEHGRSQIVKMIYPYIHDERYLNYGLSQAIKNKYYKTVVLLLKLGINPNYDDEDDGLAVLEALFNNDIWAIRLMIKYGTNVSSIKFSKKTYSKIKDLIDKQTQNVTV